MDERQALLLAATAERDDDTPRLVFADWLDENGDEHDRARAEYIRLQCELARPGPAHSLAEQSQSRTVELHNLHARAWMGPLWEITGKGYRDRDFDRGLLYWWYTTAGAFVKKANAEAVGAQFPRLGVTTLMLTDESKRFAAVFNSPALEWVCNFSWKRSRLNDDGFRALAGSLHTARISDLEIDHPNCTDAGLAALAKSSSWPNLRRLALTDGFWGGHYTAAGVLRVLNSTRLAKLCELNMSGLPQYGFRDAAFYSDPGLTRLRVLWRGGNTSLRHFAACPYLTALEEFRTHDSQMTDEDAEVMLGNTALVRLRRLALYNLNAGQKPLSDAVEKRLRDRFGNGLDLKYSALCIQG